MLITHWLAYQSMDKFDKRTSRDIIFVVFLNYSSTLIKVEGNQGTLILRDEKSNGHATIPIFRIQRWGNPLSLNITGQTELRLFEQSCLLGNFQREILRLIFQFELRSIFIYIPPLTGTSFLETRIWRTLLLARYNGFDFVASSIALKETIFALALPRTLFKLAVN